MSLGNSYPDRCSVPNTLIVRGVWTGGGAGLSLTRLATDWSRGIRSIVWTATGKYLVTFIDSGQQLVGHSSDVSSPSGSVKKSVNVIRNSYSAALKTIQVETQAAGVLADLLVTEQLICGFVLVTNKP